MRALLLNRNARMSAAAKNADCKNRLHRIVTTPVMLKIRQFVPSHVEHIASSVRTNNVVAVARSLNILMSTYPQSPPAATDNNRSINLVCSSIVSSDVMLHINKRLIDRVVKNLYPQIVS